ncbi:acetyl-CoA C-acetyltransferase [Halanaerobium saccharolyticum]|uniref:acetyl-CoA C-acetyltransferase n=1 Tax=Halanaerobium saccharolyticum TaxID=43595 RepID=A0A4R7Z7E3_9FIRM|nr:thiolase family protein [Halanaerobium saccharolyticum]RAK11085.1 acetyl-CoA C-acetyltransferase [Halanaerobium saccharolyticum]TDW06936.1 acetyl-CoA C-acetyltransferase [Halanaerobium saccharolyticum]TDX63701.1 acetyl-CoA C-acetyltransferase [Halanaerobium saccharolyticum]
MKKVYILGGLRTAIGKTGGHFKKMLPEDLTAEVLNALLEKYKLEAADINQVILGNAVGPGGNIARLSLLKAGWPLSIPATTIDFQCGSALSSINMAAALIKSGQSEIIVAGGLESTSLEIKKKLNKNDPRFQEKSDFLERAFFSPAEIGDPDMGIGAENVAELYDNISREEMDRWAIKSHQKALEAQQTGLLDDIILSVKNTRNELIDKDEGIRKNISYKLLKRLKPVFKKEGKITAGNSCLTHDGAAAVVLVSEAFLKENNLKAEAEFIMGRDRGVDPNLSPMGPVPVVREILAENKLNTSNLDAVEINEAFAVKILACSQELGLDLAKVNILGGALAYGHPYGASGAIILLHLLQSLKKINGQYGLAAMGAAGGQGVGTLIKKIG